MESIIDCYSIKSIHDVHNTTSFVAAILTALGNQQMNDLFKEPSGIRELFTLIKREEINQNLLLSATANAT